MMSLLVRLGAYAIGPALIPLLITLALGTGGLALRGAVKRHDDKVTAQCNAGWESKIREEERKAAAAAIKEARDLASNQQSTAERLQNDLEVSNARLAEYDAADSSGADPNCAPAGLLNAIEQRWQAGRVGAGAKKR